MPANGTSVADTITMAVGSVGSEAADDPEVIWTIGRLRRAPGACAGTTGRTGVTGSSRRYGHRNPGTDDQDVEIHLASMGLRAS